MEADESYPQACTHCWELCLLRFLSKLCNKQAYSNQGFKGSNKQDARIAMRHSLDATLKPESRSQMSFTNGPGCLLRLPFVNKLSNSLFLLVHFRQITYMGRKSILLTYSTMQSSTSNCKLIAFNKYVPERPSFCWAAALGASAVAKPALLATHQC